MKATINRNAMRYNDEVKKVLRELQQRAKRDWLLLVAITIYLLLCLAALGWYRHIINPDGVSYITIAEKYAHGNFSEAINGYWGPLLSWLLAPFAFMNLNMQLAAKLIVMVSGIFTIVLCYMLLRRWSVKRPFMIFYFSALIPLLLLWTMTLGITPDLLILTLFTLYVYLLTDKSTYLNSIMLGAVGALGYYAKAYFLLFFLVHVTLVRFYESRMSRKAKDRLTIRKHWFVTLSISCIMVAPWIALISGKYDHLTYSTSGSYNFSLLNPTSPGHPMNYLGLLPPSNSTAISVWEDPSYIKQASWDPLTNKMHVIRTLFDNGKRAGAALQEFSIVTTTALIIISIYIINKGRKLDKRIKVIYSAIIVYMFGYLLINPEYRYFWPVIVGLLLLAAILYEKKQLPVLRPFAKKWFTGILLLSIIAMPVSQLYYRRNLHVPAYYQAEQFRPYIKPGEHVASDSFGSIAHCFYLQARCYGAVSASLSDETSRKQLSSYKITVFIQLNSAGSQRPTYLQEFSKAIQVGESSLYVRNPAADF